MFFFSSFLQKIDQKDPLKKNEYIYFLAEAMNVVNFSKKVANKEKIIYAVVKRRKNFPLHIKQIFFSDYVLFFCFLPARFLTGFR